MQTLSPATPVPAADDRMIAAVDRDAFARALALAGHAVSPKYAARIPLLSHLLLRCDDRLAIAGTDLGGRCADVRAEACCPVASHAHCPREFTLPFPGLVKCLSDLPAGMLAIRVTPNHVDIAPAAAGATPLTFAPLGPAEFPLFPTAPAGTLVAPLHRPQRRPPPHHRHRPSRGLPALSSTAARRTRCGWRCCRLDMASTGGTIGGPVMPLLALTLVFAAMMLWLGFG
jgi:hypothetical protein